MKALRVLKRRPGLAITAAINVSLLVALLGASAQIAGDLLGLSASSRSRSGFQVSSLNGPDRQRFSFREFELISGFSAADRAVGAAGQNVLVIQPPTGPPEEIEVCYLSEGLRENLRLSTADGIPLAARGASDRR